jgi:hypothetical protein
MNTFASAPAFLAEADMLGPIARAPAALAGRRRASRNPQVLFEFFGAAGTPDVVFLEFDEHELERRDSLGLAPVLNYNAIAVLLALSTGPLDVRALSEGIGMTRAHLRRTILPDLEARAWLEHAGREWRTLERIRPLARWIVAVEAKRRDWRRAVAQAERYRSFANRAVVVLDAAANLQPVRELARSQTAVGLASLDTRRGRVEALLLPPWQRAASERDYVWAGEQAYHMRRSGVPSGPVLPVFGRTLLATNGPDPRLPNGVKNGARVDGAIGGATDAQRATAPGRGG